MRASIILVAIMLWAIAGGPASAEERPVWQDAIATARDASVDLEAQARRVIVQAGVVVYRYRHTIAGAALGCASGSLIGAGSTVVLGPVTGGATLAAAGPAALVGCAVGAAGGAAVGHSLDTDVASFE